MPVNKVAAIVLALIMALPVTIAVTQFSSNPSSSVLPHNSSIPLLASAHSASYSEFLIYAPSINELDKLVSLFSSQNFQTKLYGNLLQVDVPDNYTEMISTYLKTLSSTSEITFSTMVTKTTAEPFSIENSASKYAVIPYAYVPDQIAAAYNFTGAYSAGIKGQGITVGIVDAYGDPNLNYDVMAFNNINNLPPINLTILYPEGKPAVSNSTWALETATDVEWAHAMAPDARIVLYVTPSAITKDLQEAVSAMVSSGRVNVISLSWGNAESVLSASEISTFNMIYAQAAAQGISVFAASGDYGAYYYGSNGTAELTVNFPASDPYVTAVGGSSLYLFNGKFGQTAWGGRYEGRSYGSGGGYSSYFSRPYWQAAPGYNSNRRGVPDVSMDANQYTGMVVISGGAQFEVGGTSIATPMWAAIGAIMEQALKRPLGNINPLIYQISRTDLYNSSFTQITEGTNGYYSARSGWNPVSGLGTPNVGGLIGASEDILHGFGSEAIFTGNASYGNRISALLNATVNTSSLRGNGSEFLYVGFSGGRDNFTEFGVNYSYGVAEYELIVSQGSVSDQFTAESQTLSGSVFRISSLNLTLEYENSTLTGESNDRVIFREPMFLRYFGGFSPTVGGYSYGSFQNYTHIGNFSFSSLHIWGNSSLLTYSGIQYVTYSAPSLMGFSTIGSAYLNGTVMFSQQLNRTERYLNGSKPGNSIYYSLSYSLPVIASFHVTNFSGSAKWYVDGHISGSNVSFSHSGFFNITAQIVISRKTVNLSRTVYIPSLSYQNITVRSNASTDRYPGSSVTVDYLYSFPILNSSRIVVINSTNHFAISAPGFMGTELNSTYSRNISVVLIPFPSVISAFVFQTNATVKINGNAVTGFHGEYLSSVNPGLAWLNVTAPGFLNYSEAINAIPGKNYSYQVELKPDNSRVVKISGNIDDSIYLFPISGAIVSISNISHTYSNTSGYYVIYISKGIANIYINSSLYIPFHERILIQNSTELNFTLKPMDIAVSSFPLLKVTRYFPLFFMVGYISWTRYTGASFYEYQIYLSTNSQFFNPDILTFSSNSTTSTLLSGIYPGQTYYATAILRLTNGEVFQSQVVVISYSNPVYLLVNAVIVGGISIYLAMTIIYVKRRFSRRAPPD